MPTTGSDAKTDCVKCPKGNKCSHYGLTDPVECPEGTFQDELGDDRCHKCLAGT